MLNRQQQRKVQKQDALDLYYQQKQQKATVINMVQDDIQKIKLDLTKELMTKITAAWIVSIHDTYNYKHKRISKVMSKAMNLFECIDVGTVTLEDLVEWCKEELKIEL